MRAIGLYRYLPIEDKNSLQDIEVPTPEASGRDLLVAVKAISVNSSGSLCLPDPCTRQRT